MALEYRYEALLEALSALSLFPLPEQSRLTDGFYSNTVFF